VNNPITTVANIKGPKISLCYLITYQIPGYLGCLFGCLEGMVTLFLPLPFSNALISPFQQLFLAIGSSNN